MCAEFCVNGQLTAGTSRPVYKHNEHQETDVPEELLSGLQADYQKPEDLIGENGLHKQLTKLLVGEPWTPTEDLGHERDEALATDSETFQRFAQEFTHPLIPIRRSETRIVLLHSRRSVVQHARHSLNLSWCGLDD